MLEDSIDNKKKNQVEQLLDELSEEQINKLLDILRSDKELLVEHLLDYLKR